MSLQEAIEAAPAASDAATIPQSTRLAAMLEHPTLPVAVIRQGRVVEANAPWRALFAWPVGVSSESHVATLFGHVTSADRFERALQAGLAVAVDSPPTARSEHMLVRRDGSTFLAELVVSLLNAGDADRSLGGDAVWQVRDITVERTLRRELRDLEEYHRELSRHQWDVTFVIDRKGRFSYASSSIEGALGYRVHALLGQPFASLLEPGHAQAAERWLRAASRRRDGDADESSGDGFLLRVMHGDGRVRVLACRPRDCFDVPCIAGMVVHARDVTDEPKQAPVTALESSDGRGTLDGFVRSMSQASAASDAVDALLDGILQRCGAACASLWLVDGEAPRAAVFRDADSQRRLPPPLSSDLMLDAQVRIDDVAQSDLPAGTLISLVAAGVMAIVEAPVYSGAERIGWIAVGASAPRHWRDADVDLLTCGTLLAALLLRERPPPRAIAAETAARQFSGDALTGLPGRIDAERHVAEAVGALPHGGSVTLFCVGLDHLRQVNDGEGLAHGDAVIARAARVLQRTVGEAAFVARTSGDEFAVVVRRAETVDAEAMAQAMLDALDGVTDGRADASSTEASIGIARFPGDAADANALLLQADRAMREAKSGGRGRAAVFDARFAAGLQMRKALDAELEAALENDEFVMFYQPQIALATGEVVGLEALLRWQHPTRGMLLPDAFIGTASRRGLIDAVTKTALVQVCEQIGAWRRMADMPELPVAVNVSGRQFHDRRLPALVASALLKSGLPARLLVLEITEQNLVGDDAAVQRVVKELTRLGVRIAIGDFNVGHASFRSLRQLGVSQIKLNAAFVQGIPDDAESGIVVAAVVELARRLKYQVIAEGVETREQHDVLRAAGCEVGQGFYFGAPLSTDEIRAYLATHRRIPPH